MTELSSHDRFRALADAYGSVVARWPEQYREIATGIASTAGGKAILADAFLLDATLDAWLVPSPAAALHSRILGGAPVPARSLVVRARLWWSGVGIAAALGGAVAGAAVVAAVAPIEAASDSATSFGDVAAQES